jgi:hypothetical protein
VHSISIFLTSGEKIDIEVVEGQGFVRFEELFINGKVLQKQEVFIIDGRVKRPL